MKKSHYYRKKSTWLHTYIVFALWYLQYTAKIKDFSYSVEPAMEVLMSYFDASLYTIAQIKQLR